MVWFSDVVLIGWIPVVLFLFTALPPRRAVIVAYLLAWLFLPIKGYNLPGLPDYTKMSATTLGVMLGVMLFDSRRLFSFKPSWVDIPMFVFCTVGAASSMTNGLGPYDAMSAIVEQMITWGLPYLIGRVYFTDPQGIKELALGVVIGGLIYVPLCLIELRFSPQLHRWVYGYHQHVFYMTLRMGGYRPMVFLAHGTELGMWMTCTTVLAMWLWMGSAVKRIIGFKMIWWFLLLLVMAFLCKSAGALGLLIIGAMVVLGIRFHVARLAVATLIVVIPLYMVTRISNVVERTDLTPIANKLAGWRAADSLDHRLYCEDKYIENAMRRPLVGLARWDFRPNVVYEGRPIVNDGYWILVLSKRGLVGLVSYAAFLILPAFVLWRAVRPRAWLRVPSVAAAGGLSCVLILFGIDSLMNAMLNPIYAVACGAVLSFALALKGASAQRAAVARPVRRATPKLARDPMQL